VPGGNIHRSLSAFHGIQGVGSDATGSQVAVQVFTPEAKRPVVELGVADPFALAELADRFDGKLKVFRCFGQSQRTIWNCDVFHSTRRTWTKLKNAETPEKILRNFEVTARHLKFS
jgi:hypothetical protein